MLCGPEQGAEAYPSSDNAWDRFGEALAANGQVGRAIECYKKALSLLDRNTGINPTLRDAVRTNASR